MAQRMSPTHAFTVFLVLAALVLATLADVEKKKTTSAAKKLPTCVAPGHHPGVCVDNSHHCCPKGTHFVTGDLCKGYSGSPSVVCCAKPQVVIPKPKKAKHKKPVHKKPKSNSAFDRSTDGWHRSDCVRVAKTWLAHRIIYSQTPSVKQFITYGPGPYRPDCSGFVSAAWNEPVHPYGGWTTWMFKYKRVNHASEMKQCDAVLCNDCLPGEHHAALFWGWGKNGQPLMVEEYNWHIPITKRTWNYAYFNKFIFMRRIQWF